jgi:hypothetical protein
MKTPSLVALLAAALFASTANGQTPSPSDHAANQEVFCQGTYALCIKAACTPIPTIDRLGNYTYDRVSCSCEIENGWSMGPGQCADRIPVKHGHFVYMISTYSNLFNETNATLACSPEQLRGTPWAWCYGAPCVADERAVEAGNGAVSCTCPLETGAMQTLGGNCTTSNCTSIYSAATPEGDNIANQHFANYMEQHGYKHFPPAQMCASNPVLAPPK